MRIEATLPDSRGNAALKLAEELGLTRSQLVDEAIALFMKVVLEVKKGRRLVTIDPSHNHPACELATPTLTTLEWATASGPSIKLTADEFEKFVEVTERPPEPSEYLKQAGPEHERRLARQVDPTRRPRR